MIDLNHVLADQPYLAGDEFSMADITAFAGLAFADFVDLEMPSDLRHLAEWKARVAIRPSISGS